MKLYNKYAEWWPLLSSPADYKEEAELYRKIINKYKKNIITALELGCGGGNNASHLKKYYKLTLTDISPKMLKISQRLNPECEHVRGDMRKIKLNKKYELVFIHDAIMYMKNEDDLKSVFEVAYNHLSADGVVFIAPDFFKETFKTKTSHGGHDDPDSQRSMRYLEWIYDIDPTDNVVETDFVYMFKEKNKSVKVDYDKSINGIFSKKTWEKLLKKTGFKVHFEVINHSELEPNSYFGIIGMK